MRSSDNRLTTKVTEWRPRNCRMSGQTRGPREKKLEYLQEQEGVHLSTLDRQRGRKMDKACSPLVKAEDKSVGGFLYFV